MTPEQEFIELTKTVTNKLATNRVRLSHFVKQNKEHIWNWFLEATSLYADQEIHTRAKLVHTGQYHTRPMCAKCGEHPVQWLDGKLSKCCSAKCAATNLRPRGYKIKNREEAAAKRKATTLARYGVEHHTQRPEHKVKVGAKTSKRMLPPEALVKLNDQSWLFEQYVTQQRTVYAIAEELGVYYGTVFTYIDKFGIPRQYSMCSAGQKEMLEFIQNLLPNAEVLSDVTRLLKPSKKHIDIYVPDLQLGIEYNGLYHHSIKTNEYTKDDANAHLTKLQLAEQNGINLLFFTDEQWTHKRDIVKSIIRNKLGQSTRIFARNCDFKMSDSKTARKFFDDNHIQGFSGASHYLSLEYRGRTVAMMSFGKPRYNKNYCWELIRFACLLDHNVVGGFSRLLKRFRSLQSGSIISYADRTRSVGNVYEKNGFVLTHTTEPGYSWTDGHRSFHRSMFQKHKLVDLLEEFDPNLTEDENMFANRYFKYFDCGQLVYVLE